MSLAGFALPKLGEEGVAVKEEMVQTLATILMTYRPKPSLADCRVVSLALHKKLRFLGAQR